MDFVIDENNAAYVIVTPATRGVKGEKGDTGEMGPRGYTGDVGSKGDKGDTGEKGEKGDDGATGATGVGIPSGGTTHQIMRKASATNYDMEWADNKAARAISFFIPGELGAVPSVSQILVPYALTIAKVKCSVGTAPTGANLIVDIHKNGTTIFTTQSNRPTITAGNTSATDIIPEVESLLEGDILTLDIDQIGSTVSGSNLMVTISCGDMFAYDEFTEEQLAALKGDPGTDGTDGVGVPTGGTTGQVLTKASATDYDFAWGNASSNDVDSPPASPHAKDDEFNDSSIDSKWSWANQGSATASESGTRISITPAGDAYHRCLVQTVPSGNWQVTAKVHWGGDFVSDSYAGIVVLPSTDGGVEALNIGKDSNASPSKLRGERWSSYTSWGAERCLISFGGTWAYLRIKWDGTNLTYYASSDGVSFAKLINAFAPSITPGRVGISTRGLASPSYFDWFRVVAI